MTQATIFKKLNKTTSEMKNLIQKSKRKLLELEVLASLSEIRKGNFEIFKSSSNLFKKPK